MSSLTELFETIDRLRRSIEADKAALRDLQFERDTYAGILRRRTECRNAILQGCVEDLSTLRVDYMVALSNRGAPNSPFRSICDTVERYVYALERNNEILLAKLNATEIIEPKEEEQYDGA